MAILPKDFKLQGPPFGAALFSCAGALCIAARAARLADAAALA
jgi:hypothetical protein